jgi:DNA-binding transcriptional regulator YhcF (GntR family)
MSKPWTAVPNAAACDNTLSVNARLLYVILRTYAWNRDGEMKVWPSRETLASQMGVSVSTTKRAIKELENRRLITRKERKGTSSLTFIHDPGEVTHEQGGCSPMTHEVPSIEEEYEEDHAPQETVREVTRTEDEGDIPAELSPKGNTLRSKKKSKVNRSLAREVYHPLKGMWEEEAVNLGYQPLDETEENGILPQVVKAWKATGRKESPLNQGGFWLDVLKFRMLFLSKAGSWYCKQLAHEGKLDDQYDIPVETLRE